MTKYDGPAGAGTGLLLPAVPGLTFRRFRGAADYPAMAVVRAGSQAEDELEAGATPEDLARQFAQPKNCDPAQDLLMVEVEGQLIGYNHMRWQDLVDGTRLYHHSGYLLPGWRGNGIGRAMVRASEAHLQSRAAEHRHPGPRILSATAYNTQPRAEELFTSEGYTPALHFFEMVRPHLDAIPAVPLPPGLEVRPVEPAHYRPIWEAMNEAFSTAAGAHLHDDADYARWLDGAEFQPALWQVAWDGDQVAGMILNFVDTEANAHFGRRRGYTEDVSVRAPWRRRGLARALLTRSLQVLRAQGLTEAALTVDGANFPAMELYESLDYQAMRRFTDYRKALV